jgi:hypothetical protein
MSIVEAPFDNEAELDVWVSENIEAFLPGAVFLPGCRVTTASGKGGVPDGFAFNLREREWFIVENELLGHGVWSHIAEQIVRFVVATQNPDTRRLIRDRLFEVLIESESLGDACEVLSTTVERSLQQIELFIEGIDPQVVIFIDDTNQDLYDLAQALSTPIKIFRVKKFLVNGQTEYHSPDRNAPVIVTEPMAEIGVPITEYDVVEILGGGDLEMGAGRFKCYRMGDGSAIYIKRSKYHSRQDYYWYGITPSSLERCVECAVTHIVFVMGDEGFVRVPIATVQGFVENTRTTNNQDGTVRHYHCLISPGPEPQLYYSQELPRFDLTEHYQSV